MAVYAKPYLRVYKYVSLYLLEWRSQIIKSSIFHKSLKTLTPILKAGTERFVELEYELVEVRALLDGNPLSIPRKTHKPFDLIRKIKASLL